jgi:alpha-ketoglutarate-dependent taurine dioxygenase
LSPLGAEWRGIDLRHIDEQTFESIRRAWIDHSVILQGFCGE